MRKAIAFVSALAMIVCTACGSTRAPEPAAPPAETAAAAADNVDFIKPFDTMCDDVDAQAHLTSVQLGASFTVKEAYVLQDTSQAQLVVKPLISFTGEKFIDTGINIS